MRKEKGKFPWNIRLNQQETGLTKIYQQLLEPVLKREKLSTSSTKQRFQLKILSLRKQKVGCPNRQESNPMEVTVQFKKRDTKKNHVMKSN